ncbi:MAG TPA: tetratricopeptide repeat protein [Bryobacteraceae bacterium]|nr:tetratricopeptide repeat protein [Bryobacteraceae bacterium]
MRKLGASAMLVVFGIFVGCAISPQSKETKFLRRGEALREKKDYARALLEFKNAAEAMPRDAEPQYQMGITYLASGSLGSGIASLRKATELNPRHEQAQLKLAEVLTASSNKELVQQAASRLEAVLSASPGNSEANDALALAEWKLGKTEEAIGRLEDTLQKFPSRLQTSVELAQLQLRQKDLASAERVLKQAVASAPQASDAELALGQLYMLANEPKKAETELGKAIQLDPKNGAALMGLAAIQATGNRKEEAEQTYRKLSSLPDPQFKPLHALFLFKIGKRDDALVEFEKLARQDPNDRAARSRLVAAYLALGKDKAAQNLLNSALKENPKDTNALFERADLAFRAGNVAEATTDLYAVLHYNPDFAEAHLMMAAIFKLQGKKQSEQQELGEALRINPALLPARLQLAHSLTGAKQPKAALELLNRTPEGQKRKVGVMAERNWALLATGETKELRASLDEVLPIRHFSEFLLQDALLRMQQRDYGGARTALEEVIAENPEDVRAVRLLADAYLSEKQPAKAEERLKAIVGAHPQSAPLENLLGQWYLSARNPAAARKAFEAACAADPHFVTAQLAMANIDYRERRFDAARQRLLGLLTADPKDPSLLVMLGTVAGGMGDQEEAVRRYRAAVAVDGANVAALNDLAYTLATSDPDAALKYAQTAAELAPDDPSVNDTLGSIYYQKAIYPKAIRYLETAVAKDPTPRREYHLGMSYLRSGQNDQGAKILELALQQDPKLPTTEKGW